MSIDGLNLDWNLGIFNIIQDYKKIFEYRDKKPLINDEIVKKIIKSWKESKEEKSESNERKKAFEFLISHISEITIEFALKIIEKELVSEEINLLKIIQKKESLEFDKIEIEDFKKIGGLEIVRPNKLRPEDLDPEVINQKDILIKNYVEFDRLLKEVIEQFEKIDQCQCTEQMTIYTQELIGFFEELSCFQEKFNNLIKKSYCGISWENLAYEMLQLKEGYASILNELIINGKKIKKISKNIHYIHSQTGNARYNIAYQALNNSFGLNFHRPKLLINWKDCKAKKSWRTLSKIIFSKQSDQEIRDCFFSKSRIKKRKRE